MKKWVLRILSGILTFTVGTGAAVVGSRMFKSAAIQAASVAAKIELHLPPIQVQVAEDAPKPVEVEEVMQPHPVSISPYEIKRILDNDKLIDCGLNGYSGYFDYGVIWEKLGIKISEDSDAFPERCGSQARVEIHTLELDGKPGSETLLQLNFGMPDSTLYLIFKYSGASGSAKWHLLGYIPYVYGAPFFPPTHRVRADGARRWFIVEYSSGHGSGFGSGANDWYEVSEKSGVRKVLSYQDGLFIGFHQPAITRRTQVLNITHQDGVTTITLRASTSYEGLMGVGYEPFPLFADKRVVTFVKEPGVESFVFDTQHSELSAEEFAPYYGMDATISKGEFLKYNYRELARLAASGNAKQKDWLRNYLEDCDDTSERRSLQEALKGEQP